MAKIELEDKILELTRKQLQYTNDDIGRALESNDPIRELTRLLLDKTELLIKEKTKTETMNHIVSEQYWK